MRWRWRWSGWELSGIAWSSSEPVSDSEHDGRDYTQGRRQDAGAHHRAARVLEPPSEAWMGKVPRVRSVWIRHAAGGHTDESSKYKQATAEEHRHNRDDQHASHARDHTAADLRNWLEVE